MNWFRLVQDRVHCYGNGQRSNSHFLKNSFPLDFSNKHMKVTQPEQEVLDMCGR